MDQSTNEHGTDPDGVGSFTTESTSDRKSDPTNNGVSPARSRRELRSVAASQPVTSPSRPASLSRSPLRMLALSKAARGTAVAPVASSATLATASGTVTTPTSAKVATSKMLSWKRTLLNAGAMTAATAIVATLALPGTPIPVANAESNETAEAYAELQATSSQEIELTADEAVIIDASRGEFTATDPAVLRRAQLTAQRAAAAAAWSGPRVSDLLANPPYPNFSLDQVVQVGLQFQGVPYQRGGATPAGFDCSGFTQYVYAQFGISLPHSVSGQDRAGTRISRADALPGDLVIMRGHNGIYMGNGTFLDAPRAGGVVSVRPIWTDNYWIVRIGI